MNNNKLITVTVAIAAYNAEKNIKKLTESVLNQKQKNYKLVKVLINSDMSTDKSIEKLREIKNNILEINDSKKRLGFAGTIIKLVKSNKSDVLVLLNDDIIISDFFFLEKLIQPFLHENKVGLVCGNPTAIESRNFVSEAVRSGYIAYKKMADTNKGGNNIFTVDGKILAVSKQFTDTVEFPKDLRIMGNVDKYIYFLNITNNLNYYFVKNAVVNFKMPTTIKDFIRWQTRNYKSNKYIMREAWGKLVEKEYEYSKHSFRYYKLIEFLKNPLGSVFILILGIYCSYNAKKEQSSFETKWDLVSTTKDI